MLRDVFDLSPARDSISVVAQVGNHAILQRVPLVGVRYIYTPVPAGDAAAAEFAVAMGHVYEPALDADDGERRVLTYLSDAGPGGVLALFRNLVYRDLRLPPPPERAGSAVAATPFAMRCAAFRIRPRSPPARWRAAGRSRPAPSRCGDCF